MKKGLNHLPPEKREDIYQLVELIREQLNDCVMIILFGSYARGTYVDYDQRTEYGVPTYYMSDYDFLIVTKRHLGPFKQLVYKKILDKFFINKVRDFHTQPQFVNVKISKLNKAIEMRQYFFTQIKKEGILLFDSGEYKLARRRKLNYSEIAKLAQKFYTNKFRQATDFFEDAETNVAKGKYAHASFHVNQAVENYLRMIELVYILHSPKTHALTSLMEQIKKHTPEVFKVFQFDNEEDSRLFSLLEDAYVQARYNDGFIVSENDILSLIEKMKMLRDISRNACDERINYYQKMAANEVRKT